MADNEYKASFSINKPMILYKDDLYELEALIRQNVKMERSADFEINVDVEDEYVTKQSVDELHLEKLPKRNYEIKFRGTGWDREKSGKQLVERIYVSLSGKMVFVSISGENQVWVYGVKQALNNYFKEKQTKYANFYSFLQYVPFFLLGSGISGLMFNHLHISISLLLIAGSVIYITLFNKNIIFPFMRINSYYRSEVKKGKWSKEGIIGIALTIIFGVLSMVVPQFL